MLAITGYYPTARKPFVGTFFDRRVRQLTDNGCDVTVLTTKVLTPATLFRSRRDVVDFIRTPRYFSYIWNSQSISGIRIMFPVAGKITAAIQYHLFYKAIVPILNDFLQRDNPPDLLMLLHGGTLSRAVCRYAGDVNIPYVTWATGGDIISYYNKPDSYMYRQQKKILLGSKLVICVSNDIAFKVRQITNDKVETFTFYTGVDTESFCPDTQLRDRFRSNLCYNDSAKVLCFVGHLIREKGIYELLRVFAHLALKDKSLKLLLVGPPLERKQIEQAIRDLNLWPHVHMTGPVEHKQIAGYLNAADIFIFPSWSEGLPNAVIEACSCGLPILASNVGGTSEIIVSGKNGLLVAPRNEELLYDAACTLLSSSSLCKSFGKESREIIVRKFNYHSNGKALTAKLKTIL
jgi:teichuronic acid biosynthesis glycosyltransferase TuaC